MGGKEDDGGWLKSIADEIDPDSLDELYSSIGDHDTADAVPHLFDGSAAEAALPSLKPHTTPRPQEKPPLFDLAAAQDALPLRGIAINFPKKSTLSSLPDDILKCVFDHIVSRFYLRDCQLVNRKFHTLTLAQMYRRLTFHVQGEPGSIHDGLLEPKHSGLRHVRKLTLYPSKDGNVKFEMCEWIGKFLARLSKGQLERFDWFCRWSMPSMLLTALWHRQRALKHLSFGILTEAEDSVSFSAHFHSIIARATPPLGLQEVRISSNCVSSLAAPSELLLLPSVVSLKVDALNWHGSNPRQMLDPLGDLNDEVKIPDKLTDTLFRRVPRTFDGETLLTGRITKLKVLHLSDINLRYCEKSWFRYLDLAGLEELSLKYCQCADRFLACLSKKPPRLRELVYTHKVENLGLDNSHAQLSEVIRNACSENSPDRGLRRLEIHLRNFSYCQPVSMEELFAEINKHHRTLKMLAIDIAGEEQRSRYECTAALLATLVRDCRRLRELSIGCPSYSWIYLPGHFWAKNPQLKAFVKTLVSHTTLEILNVLNFPVDCKAGAEPAYYASMESRLGAIANEIFREFWNRIDRRDERASQLGVIAFGIRERGAVPVPRYFVPAETYYLSWKHTTSTPLRLCYLKFDRITGKLLKIPWLVFDKVAREKRDEWPFYIDDEVAMKRYAGKQRKPPTWHPNVSQVYDSASVFDTDDDGAPKAEGSEMSD